jgi:glutamine amidotransferase
MIAIVDYGMGNLGSIANMLRRLDLQWVLTSDPRDLAEADRLILPGVGAFDRGMAALDALQLRSVLDQRVMLEGVPVLGICLGLQLMARNSEEGERDGLGWLAADVVRFRVPDGSPVKVPHMGWNSVVPTQPTPLLDDGDEARFYFVHSYHLDCDRRELVLADAYHGYRFPAVVGSGNVLGVQFHPEKSHRFGLALLERFAAFVPVAAS